MKINLLFFKSIWRKIQRSGYSGLYIENLPFRNGAHRLAALAFIDVAQVNATFDELYDELISIDDEEGQAGLRELLDYFETTFIRTRNNGQPLFAPSLWNQKGNILSNLPRTNNRCEGWHRHFIGMASTVHPRVIDFIELVKKDMTSSNVKLDQEESGHAPTPSRPIYLNQAERIRLILRSQLSNIEITKRIANVFHFNPLN